MSSLSFRQAELADTRLLSQIGARSFREAYVQLWNPDDLQVYAAQAFSEAQIGRELADENAFFILAFSSDVPAGYAKLVWNHSPPVLPGIRAIQIGRFYLLSDYTGKGLGSQLMEQCLSLAKRAGFEMIWLAVWELNRKAIAFYKRHGFEVGGTYPFRWGDQVDEDLLMKRKVDQEHAAGL